jgi:hypothetical protein
LQGELPIFVNLLLAIVAVAPSLLRSLLPRRRSSEIINLKN